MLIICIGIGLLGDDADAVVVLPSKEGICQGCPLAMLLYGIVLPPLAERLKEAVPNSLQPWFSDDSAVIRTSEKCAEVMKWLIRFRERLDFGFGFGYHPAEPSKSWYICCTEEHSVHQEFKLRGININYLREK